MSINESVIIKSRNIRSRLSELDILKGIGILGVAMIHAVQHSLYFSNPNIYFAVFLDSISRFCVPLFIFVSGVSFSYNYYDKEKYFSSFLYKRFKFIIIPYLFWNILALVYKRAFMLKEILVGIFLGKSMIHLYFVPLIFQFYFISPLVMKVCKINWRHTIIISFLIHIIILVVYRLASLYGDRTSDDLVSCIFWFPYKYAFLNFVFWFSYFVIGVCFGISIERFKGLLNRIKWITLVPISLIIASISIYDEFFSLFRNISRGGMQFFSPINMIYSFVSIIFIWKSYKIINSKIKSILILLGKYSFGIYLIHVPILHGIHKITEGYWGNPLEIIFSFVTAVTISFILTLIISKVKFGYYIVGKAG